MNARQWVWAAGTVAVGMVAGFVLATFGAGVNQATATAERDATRDKLADQVRLAMDTGADLVREARAAQANAEAELKASKPKQVKGQ